ncbi:nitroreductase family protein [candidate division KSB1 bacterium]|nr:nitroreductase family protein [candidate division KSB1 bacterium]
MDCITAIRNRASVRQFTPQKVSHELLMQLVDAGRRAPSGRNVQPIEFVVVTDAEIREQLAELCDYGKFLRQSPACIVVYSKDVKYFLEDGSAAVENILLAATALGLGACWIAGDKKPYASEIDKILGAPEGYRLIATIAVGYAAEPVRQKEKRPLEQVLHWQRFTQR